MNSKKIDRLLYKVLYKGGSRRRPRPQDNDYDSDNDSDSDNE